MICFSPYQNTPRYFDSALLQDAPLLYNCNIKLERHFSLFLVITVFCAKATECCHKVINNSCQLHEETQFYISFLHRIDPCSKL